MNSSKPDTPMQEGEEEEGSSIGDSFYAKILDSSRIKTNGEGEIDEDMELTPEEMKKLAASWVGKKINLRHDLKGGFGKITAAWHTKDGKTHVRMSPGTSEAGKKASEMIKNGEITSVSAGWKVHKDGDAGPVVRKSTDHVALTNLPVYEGTVIYAMASKDKGINVDSNGILRTKGGLAILPVIENTEAAVVVHAATDSSKPKEQHEEKKEPNIKGKEKMEEDDEEHEMELESKPQSVTESLWNSVFGFSPRERAEEAGNKANRKPLSSQSTKEVESEPVKKTNSIFGLFGMASADTPPPTTTPSDHGGHNASTVLMDSIFGGIGGPTRDALGRFSRKATHAPNSSVGVFTSPPGQAEKRPLEPEQDSATQPEAKRPALPSATSGLEGNLDNDTPVYVDSQTFRSLNAKEIELKQALEKITELETEKTKWDELKQAAGAHDHAGAKRIVERATDEYAQGEVTKINEAIKYLGGLSDRITHPEWKAHVATTGERMADLAKNKTEILSEAYNANSLPIVSTMVAASFDIQRQVGEASAEADSWKTKYEEERGERIRLEEHVNVLERGNRSSTSSWNVHASRDVVAPSSSTASSFGLSASSSGGTQSSLFSKASSVPRASYSATSSFSAASTSPQTSASSGLGHGVPTPASSASGAQSTGSVPQEQPRAEQGSSNLFQARTQQQISFGFDSPMEAFGGIIDPRMADAMLLTKQRRSHTFGSGSHANASKIQMQNAKALKTADVLSSDMAHWGTGRGPTRINVPVYGDTIFT